MKKLWIIGIGMGNPDTMTQEALKKIGQSQAVTGAKRIVESVGPVAARTHYAIDPAEILTWLREQEDVEEAAVLMSGDTGFFSGTKKLAALAQREGDWQVEVIPGISSLQYFCAKLKTSWDDVKIISLHGRSSTFTGEVQSHEKVFFLTDREHTPAYICRSLTEAGMGHVQVFAGQQLSYPEERILSGTAAELQDQSFDPLSVVLVQNPGVNQTAAQNKIITHGLPDDVFIRGKVPMTKQEVRSVTLSKLGICPEDVIYDVGAGTGSVSVEMALQAFKGHVYAIETKDEALRLIEANREKLGAWNLTAVQGMAPEAFLPLPPPDKAFIGGSKGNMDDIIAALLEKNPHIRISVNVIALESLAEAVKSFEHHGLEDVDIVQISAARAKELGKYHLMTGQNPVFILTAQKREASHD